MIRIFLSWAAAGAGLTGGVYAAEETATKLRARRARKIAAAADRRFRDSLNELIVAGCLDSLPPERAAWLQSMALAMNWWVDEHPGEPAPRSGLIPADAPDREHILVAWYLEHKPAEIAQLVELRAISP